MPRCKRSRGRTIIAISKEAVCTNPFRPISPYSGAIRAHEEYNASLRDLSFRPRSNEANDRLANHLYNHTGEWFMFLVDPSIPATNYRGEQALKVPIVNRKVWGGNRAPAGADAQVVNASVIATCKNRVQSAITFISQAVCGFVGSLFTTATKD
jgi:transposase